jgi:hypothetical protein
VQKFVCWEVDWWQQVTAKECFASGLNFVILGQHYGEIWIALGRERGCILAKILKLKYG